MQAFRGGSGRQVASGKGTTRRSRYACSRSFPIRQSSGGCGSGAELQRRADRVREDLRSFEQALADSPELNNALASPAVKRPREAQRHRAAGAVARAIAAWPRIFCSCWSITGGLRSCPTSSLAFEKTGG